MKTTLLRKLRQHVINVQYYYHCRSIYVYYWTLDNTVEFTRLDYDAGNADVDKAIFQIVRRTLGLLECAILMFLRRRTIKARNKHYAAQIAVTPVKFEFKGYGKHKDTL